MSTINHGSDKQDGKSNEKQGFDLIELIRKVAWYRVTLGVLSITIVVVEA